MACPFVHSPLSRLQNFARPRQAARRVRLDEFYLLVSSARRSLQPLEPQAGRIVLLGCEQLGPSLVHYSAAALTLLEKFAGP